MYNRHKNNKEVRYGDSIGFDANWVSSRGFYSMAPACVVGAEIAPTKTLARKSLYAGQGIQVEGLE